MKISKLSRIILSTGLVALLSADACAASLKGIELDENLNTACDKFKAIYKDNKKVQIILNNKKHTCGWDNMLFGFVGIIANNNDEVQSINIPVDVFGFSVFEGAKSISDKYVKSEGAAVRVMEYYKDGKYEYYQGYNLYGQLQVTIDAMFIKLENESAAEPVNFK